MAPVLGSLRGLALSQSVLPQYAAIDAYHMTTAVIDETVRRLLAVGGDPDHIGGVDNFCWPQYPVRPGFQPGRQVQGGPVVRANQALKETCEAYGIPLLSGKDSMYVDGSLPGEFGERHKVSGLPTLQFTAISAVSDVTACQTLDFKDSGDPIYMIGLTADELGGSEYYELLGYVGCNVPQTDLAANMKHYRAFYQAMREGLIASAKTVGRGGLGVATALSSLAGGAAPSSTWMNSRPRSTLLPTARSFPNPPAACWYRCGRTTGNDSKQFFPDSPAPSWAKCGPMQSC